jgi:hypothetical protein
LKGAGCDPVFSDKASGKSMAGRPELIDALAELGEGDELVIAWDPPSPSRSHPTRSAGAFPLGVWTLWAPGLTGDRGRRRIILLPLRAAAGISSST